VTRRGKQIHNAYYAAEKKIKPALKSGATELTIRHPFIRFAKQSVDDLSVENKGGNRGA
jgi:hypothetical protein